MKTAQNLRNFAFITSRYVVTDGLQQVFTPPKPSPPLDQNAFHRPGTNNSSVTLLKLKLVIAGSLEK